MKPRVPLFRLKFLERRLDAGRVTVQNRGRFFISDFDEVRDLLNAIRELIQVREQIVEPSEEPVEALGDEPVDKPVEESVEEPVKARGGKRVAVEESAR